MLDKTKGYRFSCCFSGCKVHTRRAYTLEAAEKEAVKDGILTALDGKRYCIEHMPTHVAPDITRVPPFPSGSV